MYCKAMDKDKATAGKRVKGLRNVHVIDTTLVLSIAALFAKYGCDGPTTKGFLFKLQ